MSKYNSVHLLIVDFVDTNVSSSLVCKYVFAYFVSFFITSVKLTQGGDSHMKRTGMLVRNFEFNP